MSHPENSERTYRILIVDDHEDNVEILRARLEGWGYATDTANGGEQALQIVATSPPDLILLDVMMPGMDGHEVARRIKGDESLPFIPIIMQTALDSTEHKVEGLGAGADDYITKPIEFPELQARVKSMLRIKSLQAEVERQRNELEKMNEKLLRVSRTDGLTGLHNRRYIEEHLEEMWQHSQRLGEPIAVVMCDLDKFKSVNDTYGHQAGDAVLRQFARILEGEAREIDRVGRYGGEEFMLLLPGTVSDAAGIFAERVRAAVEAHQFDLGEGTTIVRTASFGVSAWPHPSLRRCDDLVRHADEALYVAKETGRNRVVCYDTEEFNAHVEREQTSGDADRGLAGDAPVAAGGHDSAAQPFA